MNIIIIILIVIFIFKLLSPSTKENVTFETGGDFRYDQSSPIEDNYTTI